MLPDALAALAEYDQFIVWQSRPKPKGGKPIKVPVDYRTLKDADPHNPHNWTDAATIFPLVKLLGNDYGVGFVLTASDPFFCLDIDDCLGPDNQRSPLSQQLIQQLPGAAVEVSHSGRGLHIWGTSRPMPLHGCRNVKRGIELYSAKQFIALGRPGADGDAGTDCTAALKALVATYFPATIKAAPGENAWTAAPCEGWDGYTDDAELINAALNARPSATAVFGDGVTFRDLWEANAIALGKKWPHVENPYDASSADASLAQRLAFWTGNDCERIRTLMRRSSLVRDKWAREDYLPRTILKAVSLQTDVYQQRATTVDKPTGGGDLWLCGETDIANVLADEREDLTCYDAKRKKWYAREAGRLWREDTSAIAIRERIRHKMTFTEKLKTGSRVRGILYLLESALGSVEAWDADLDMCGLPDDRVLLLESGNVRDAEKSDRISRRLGAVPEKGTPTRWLQFLYETVIEADAANVIAYLQRWLGYVLTGHTREHKFLFLSGSGGNGKGTFVETLKEIMGDYAEAIPADGLLGGRNQHRQWITLCDGPRMGYLNEIAHGAQWNDADLKDLTGGGTISANRMRTDSYTFTPTTKLIISGNNRPSLSSVDTAMKRRLVLIEFNRTPRREDEKLPEQLRVERERILNWILEGARAYYQSGLLDLPASVQEATRDYFEDEDHVSRFLDERFIQTPSGWVTNADLKAAYHGWKIVNDVQGSDVSIIKELKKRGQFKYDRTNTDRGFYGLQKRV